MIEYIIKGLTLGLSAGMIPGAFQVFLISQTLKNGWRHALLAAFAPLASDGPIILLVLLVLSQIPSWFLSAIQIFGGLFVLYLAWGAYRAFRSTENPIETASESANQSFLKAIGVNLLNPAPYIFWFTVNGPIVVEAWREAPILSISFATSFYTGLIGMLSVWVVLTATASRAGGAVSRTLSGLSALALLLFGLYQLWSGIMGQVVLPAS